MRPVVLAAVSGLLMLSGPSAHALGLVRVQSRSFVYTMREDGMAAQSWTNLVAGSRLALGGGPELELETGDNPAAPARVVLQPEGAPEVASDGSKAVVHLRSADGSLAVAVTYVADAQWPIMHKSATVTNVGNTAVRLLNVVLGRYPAGGAKLEGGERGFPLYIDGRYFLSLTHPAGFCHAEGGEIVLRQYPGARIAPGQSFQCMEAVYGVAKPGGARAVFVDYVRSRMYRVMHGHDKPYAILEAFGGQPDGDFKVNFSIGVAESYVLRHLSEVQDSRQRNGVQFDFYGLEFWHDRAGDLTGFDRGNFPNGFGRVKGEILKLGMKPGLWISSGGIPSWSIDQNPAVKGCFTIRDSEGSFCQACEPISRLYRDGFIYQMRENKVGLLKFDSLDGNCVNPAHDHLPGPLYSTEAIYNGVIGLLAALHDANPDVFIMLYWGYRSPWWLQHADTYFECGDQIEAASPAQYPTPYARDAVTQRLDQAQLKITDTPWLGKDSLGVWLSDWAWNSGIGKARWQEGVIMDIARGSLLFQLWTDADWLTPPERAQVATFIDLLRANPGCFRNSRFVLGNPEHAEPYGYSCADGKRAFLAINNACLRDSVVRLKLGPDYGLPKKTAWDVYRWYPRPARLTSHGGAVGGELSIALRPYEVSLIEVVPAGGKPPLGRSFPSEETGLSFQESTRPLPLKAIVRAAQPGPASRWASLAPSSATSAKGATLTVEGDNSILAGGQNPPYDTFTVTAPTNSTGITGVLLEALTDDSLPAHGPGRAENGNFALTDVRVQVAPSDHPDRVQDAPIRSAIADYSQTSYGGWPASAAIDNDPRSGWSIHPREGVPHAVVFGLERSVGFPEGTVVTVTLVNGERGHSLGRFRISVTGDAEPALPIGYRPSTVALSGHLPPTRTGGLLFLAGGTADAAPRCSVGGHPVALTPVWSANSSWGCPWSAWRAEIGPSANSRALSIGIDRTAPQPGGGLTAHFLPD